MENFNKGYQKCIFIVGVEGCGKSTLSWYIAKKFEKPIVIVEPDIFGDRFTDVDIHEKPESIRKKGRVIYSNHEGDLFGDLLKIRNKVIVFDDFKMIGEQLTRLPDNLKTLFGRRRQMNNDIVLSLHGFKDIPARAYTHMSHLIVFKTRDSTDLLKKHIGSERYQTIEETRIRVNNKGEKNIRYFEVLSF